LVFSDASEIIRILFENAPIFFIAYLMSISAISPGKIGFVSFDTTVQPQLVLILETTIGAFPMFLKTNVRFPSVFCLMLP
jgi:hypothetical protein